MLHATHEKCLRGVRKDGRFRADKSRQRRKAVWFVKPGNADWAIRHAMRRHKCGPTSVVLVYVDVSRGWLSHHGGGLYYVLGDVPAERIRRVASWRVETVSEG